LRFAGTAIVRLLRWCALGSSENLAEPLNEGADVVVRQVTFEQMVCSGCNVEPPDYRKSRVFTLILSMCRSGT
jgi:hypothetical protein